MASVLSNSADALMCQAMREFFRYDFEGQHGKAGVEELHVEGSQELQLLTEHNMIHLRKLAASELQRHCQIVMMWKARQVENCKPSLLARSELDGTYAHDSENRGGEGCSSENDRANRGHCGRCQHLLIHRR